MPLNYEKRQTVKFINIGRANSCDLVLDHSTVSRRHARVERSDDGRLSIHDNDSSNGTFLHRYGHWIRADRIHLCRQDKLRFGAAEVDLKQLVSLFGPANRVWLPAVPQLLGTAGSEPLTAGSETALIQKPRRNPLTGKIEEIRHD